MFYRTDTNAHGMRHDPFKAIVAPRPIGWIGTKGRDGSLNLSPYSFFNIVSDNPKIVMFSSSGRKHSLKNASDTGFFTASMASRHVSEQVNASSAPVDYGVNEFDLAGLTARMGEVVDAPYVAEAYTALECRLTEVIQPKDLKGELTDAYMVFGEVVGIHISEDIIRDGRIDMQLARPVGRMGYRDYSDAGEGVFELIRPT
ncbi:flavin reductase [Rhizobium sp. Leaf306]|jgi:flavin reductase (DIM6/NTAB) family NADH-FMN oxidoreductase RutF|uniref:Flavin reductase (DIM6/NTAB) family NADH-FMN oxidoreductase RutF n=1 Tax=Rhizobium soli TaxID=424798 RepID=A0A7X0MS89_9HYPH|nr:MULTISPECIES: flavin reductase family protein [Rhizobium]RYE68270.1 MAG: flavin reductase family protein [Rhizobiaceae bacterium]KQQ37063.1 flavin reductase [Rhizobium sp. Leaf306]MBB6509434.1 flavin reductase (DIM6/NTAB) family NADH-FMN oxidoreductase RutF [Rhizobium soli]MBP2461139.1 flavin reductase (DIM6/NTAB) family NADH-FMN oxidoreductase RutF [Rhizobium sp. PvP014]MBP2528535.1 flavin reductase (DIM6/NTAB) family NADH-FMN oxidoreductase RutF [Rhizobium sp. PvP099]